MDTREQLFKTRQRFSKPSNDDFWAYCYLITVPEFQITQNKRSLKSIFGKHQKSSLKRAMDVQFTYYFGKL